MEESLSERDIIELPLEIWVRCFGFLSAVAELGVVCRVCRTFQHAALLLRTELRLEDVAWGQQVATDEWITALPVSWPMLRTLSLPASRNLTDKGFRAIARLTRLRELDVSETQISAAAVAHIAAHLPELRFLNLNATRVKTQVVATLTALTSLESLRIRGCPHVASADAAMSLARLTSLTHLELSVCFDGTSLDALTFSLARLRSLDVSGCRLPKADDCLYLTRFSALTSLKMELCLLDGRSLIALLRALTTLEVLHLGTLEDDREPVSPAVSADIVHSVVSLPRLRVLRAVSQSLNDLSSDLLPARARATRLESLELRHMTNLDNVAHFEHYSRLSRLQVLHLNDTDVDDVTLRILADQLPELRDLSLRLCSFLSSDGAGDAIVRWSKLERLNIALNFWVHDDTLDTLASRLPRLLELCIETCSMLGPEGFKHVARFSKLRKLDVPRNEALDKASLVSLATMTTLRELNITGCTALSDTCVAAILQMRSLRKLWCAQTSISSHGLSNLRRLPLRHLAPNPALWQP
eukprot:TRINITY_DN15294_c0_g1_i1.p1 TRINITY_DN15294_c0_g1~~TRINITY_DN15294_c0_g1_i1.p1  ORF type:complete len:569 (-),score=95.43 TRINITY_DN15294_c0_g1_i1:195-1775(-)